MSCTLFAFIGFMVAMRFLWAFLSLICDMFATVEGHSGKLIFGKLGNL